MVINAANIDTDLAYFETMKHRYDSSVEFEWHIEQANLAVQGPRAAELIADVLRINNLEALPFMSSLATTWQANHVLLTRCGMTGEDGFEVSLPNAAVETF